MLLTADVGNTNITLGVFDGEKLKGTFRLTTGWERTSDEFGTFLRSILSRNGVKADDVEDCIIAANSLPIGIVRFVVTTVASSDEAAANA